MRQVHIEDAETLAVALKQEISRSEDARYDHRLHGLLLICQGMTIQAVSHYLGQARRTVQYWVDRFRADGLAGLRERPRSGRPAQLSRQQRAAIGRDLRRSPRDLGYEQNGWDGRLLSHHLALRYGVQLQVRQCQRLFHELGFRLRKPRSVVAGADPQAQAAFKKLRRYRLDPRVDLWFLDECHFQQHGSRARLWVPPETKTPVLYHAYPQEHRLLRGATPGGWHFPGPVGQPLQR